VIRGLKNSLTAVGAAETFAPICHKMQTAKGHGLTFKIECASKTPELRILSVNITPKDKNHSTTRYVCRGSTEQIARYLASTPEETWKELVEELVRGCDSFYYP